ncbi:unnamed protein product [Closterium sp. Naga37s-1]|nr:unnamed protein product [Closterium sp. Naga37s-1]
MMLSEGSAYGKARKSAAKDLVDAHKEFYNASSAYADSLKTAGTALLIYCEGTNIFIGSALGANVPPQAFQNVPPVQVSEVSGEGAAAGDTAENAAGNAVERSGSEASNSIVLAGPGSSAALPAPTPVPPQLVAPSPSPPPPPRDAAPGATPPPGPGGLPPAYPYGSAQYPPPPPGSGYPPPPLIGGGTPPPPGGSAYPPPPPYQGTPPSYQGTPPAAYPQSSSGGGYGGPPPPYPPQGTPAPPFPGYGSPGGAPPPAGGYSGGYSGAYPPPPPPGGAYGGPPPAPAGGAGGWEQRPQAQLPPPHGAGNSGQMLSSSGNFGPPGASGMMGGSSGMLGGSGQIIAYVGPSGGAVLGDKWADEFAKKVNAHFLEASARITALVELLKVGAPIPKNAVPPLTVAAATKEGGQLESIGDTVQKLLNWERDIKDKIWDMETIRTELKSKDKRVRTETKRASGNANADPRKLEGAQVKLGDVQHRMAGASERVVTACHAVEAYKTDLLFPQLLRLLPCLVSTWHSLSQLHDQQQQLATMLANHYMPPVTHEGATTAGQAPLTPGVMQVPSTTKAQHEATKKLDDAFKKWHSSLSVLCAAQRKFFSALITWVRKTLAFPPDFPKPPLPGTAPPPGQYVASWAPGGAAGATPAPPPPPPPGQQHVEGPLVALGNDWVRTMDRLPEKEVKDAVMGFCGWINQAYERQKAEMKQLKLLQDSLKQLSKQESKLEQLQQKERELQLALGGPAAAGAETPAEQQAKQAKAAAAAAEVASCRVALENARNKVNAESVALERLGADARAAALSGLRQGLPVVFENAGRFSGTASQAYAMLQTQHAPWLPVQV